MIWAIYIALLLLVMILIGTIMKNFDLLKSSIIPGRSSHTTNAYLGGGIYILCGMLIINLFHTPNIEVQKIIFGSIIFGFIGLVDDFWTIHFKWKLILQLFATSIFLYWNNLFLTTLDFSFITISIGWIGLIITTLAVLLVVNAFNYLDGLDGLYLMIFLLMITILQSLIQGGDYGNLILAFSLMCLIFLIANFAFLGMPKQFLGDGGNYMLSFFIAMFYLQNIQTSNFSVSLNGQVFGLWFFGLLLFEFLAVSLIRLLQQKSIFIPDRDHLHHVVYDKLNQHGKVSLIIAGIYLLLTMIGLVMTIYFAKYSFALYVALLSIYVWARVSYKRNLIKTEDLQGNKGVS